MQLKIVISSHYYYCCHYHGYPYFLFSWLSRPFTLPPGWGPRSAWIGLGTGCSLYVCDLNQTWIRKCDVFITPDVVIHLQRFLTTALCSKQQMTRGGMGTTLSPNPDRRQMWPPPILGQPSAMRRPALSPSSVRNVSLEWMPPLLTCKGKKDVSVYWSAWDLVACVVICFRLCPGAYK